MPVCNMQGKSPPTPLSSFSCKQTIDFNCQNCKKRRFLPSGLRDGLVFPNYYGFSSNPSLMTSLNRKFYVCFLGRHDDQQLCVGLSSSAPLQILKVYPIDIVNNELSFSKVFDVILLSSHSGNHFFSKVLQLLIKCKSL